MKKLALALALTLALPALARADDVWVLRAHITAGANGKEYDLLRYTKKTFDSEQACKDFLAAGGDDEFKASTMMLPSIAKDRYGDDAKVTVACELPGNGA
jgi:hypothetical protein